MGKKTLKYSEAMDELNQILEDLQSERIDLDDLSAKVKRATELIRLCKDKIKNTEMEVTKIVKEFEQELDRK
ncbi:MAG: exodeoxyribonuclease VII small subunit [Candidatus Omnitrophota bacterium]